MHHIAWQIAREYTYVALYLVKPGDHCAPALSRYSPLVNLKNHVDNGAGACSQAWKKIETAKHRSEEILRLREQNEKRVVERITAAERQVSVDKVGEP